MIPADYPFALYRGDSQRWRFKFYQSPGVPSDLTGVTPKSQIRDRPGGTQISNLVCSLTLPNIVDVVLEAEISRALPQKGAWDLQLTYTSGDVQTPIGGAVTVQPDVTDSTPEPPP